MTEDDRKAEITEFLPAKGEEPPKKEVHVPLERFPFDARVAVHFFGGKSVFDIAHIEKCMLAKVEDSIRVRFREITLHADYLIKELKSHIKDYEARHAEIAMRDTLGSQSDPEMWAESGKRDVYFECAQDMQTIIDTSWSNRHADQRAPASPRRQEAASDAEADTPQPDV